MAHMTTSTGVASALTTGVLIVHSCPPALVSQVEWAIASEIGTIVKLDWSPQPLMPELLRTSFEWRGPVPTGAAVSSSLFGWQHLRFEMIQDRTALGDGGRWMHTPALGLFHQQLDEAGNAVLTENTVRAILSRTTGADASKLAQEFRAALGAAWDAELEPFRVAEEGDATIFALPRLNAG